MWRQGLRTTDQGYPYHDIILLHVFKIDFSGCSRFHSILDLMSMSKGANFITSCLSFSDGKWVTSHDLQYNRFYHSSWMSQHGLVLMGGGGGFGDTTEILTDEGSTPGFTLKYEL